MARLKGRSVHASAPVTWREILIAMIGTGSSMRIPRVSTSFTLALLPQAAIIEILR